jgi:hypothetical protein
MWVLLRPLRFGGAHHANGTTIGLAVNRFRHREKDAERHRSVTMSLLLRAPMPASPSLCRSSRVRHCVVPEQGAPLSAFGPKLAARVTAGQLNAGHKKRNESPWPAPFHDDSDAIGHGPLSTWGAISLR